MDNEFDEYIVDEAGDLADALDGALDDIVLPLVRGEVDEIPAAGRRSRWPIG